MILPNIIAHTHPVIDWVFLCQKSTINQNEKDNNILTRIIILHRSSGSGNPASNLRAILPGPVELGLERDDGQRRLRLPRRVLGWGGEGVRGRVRGRE